MTCGYDLFGLREDGLCPECGQPASHSIAADRLAHLPMAHLKSLARGCLLVQWGMSLFGLSIPFAFTQREFVRSGFWPGLGLISIIQLVGIALSARGWWRLTTPKGEWWRGTLARRASVIRAVTIALLVLEPLRAALKIGAQPPFPWDWPFLHGDLLFHLNGATFYLVQVACVVRFFASMTLFREYAKRVPSPRLEKNAKVLRIALPLLVVPGFLLCGIGPIVAWASYLALVSEIRFAVRLLIRAYHPSDQATS